MGSLRRERLDHILILSPAHLHHIVIEYATYFNRMHPHQGIGQRIPEVKEASAPVDDMSGKSIVHPILSGLHHDYRRVA